LSTGKVQPSTTISCFHFHWIEHIVRLQPLTFALRLHCARSYHPWVASFHVTLMYRIFGFQLLMGWLNHTISNSNLTFRLNLCFTAELDLTGVIWVDIGKVFVSCWYLAVADRAL
jgi:hypothetical protein